MRAGGAATVWPSESGDPGSARLFALPIPMIDHQFVVLTSRWDGTATDAGARPSAAQVEVLELFAAQAGASLHNAQVHQGLEELKDRLDHEASHDSLTNLANRRRFTDELQRVTRRGRPGDLIGVLFLDLDGFKVVNDRYGHEVGNDLLIAVASRLRSCVRPGDLVARLGGDEFTIMLTRLESVAPAASIATRICELLERAVLHRPPGDPHLDERRHRLRPEPERGHHGSAPPGRRRDVSVQVRGQGALDDGPGIARNRGWDRARILTRGSGRTIEPDVEKPLKLRLISPFPRGERATMHRYFPTSHGGNVNRSQLLNELAERNEWTRREADTFLTSFTDLITATVATGEDVAISGFAKFRRIDRPARMARNPATGEQVRVAAKRVARITPLKAFKDAVLSGKKAREEGPAKKAPAKKTAAKKAPAKKTAAKKAPAKKKAAAKRR